VKEQVARNEAKQSPCNDISTLNPEEPFVFKMLKSGKILQVLQKKHFGSLIFSVVNNLHDE
jgi:hypothetical protein